MYFSISSTEVWVSPYGCYMHAVKVAIDFTIPATSYFISCSSISEKGSMDNGLSEDIQLSF
jgi:hypothetical protein